MTGDQWIKSAYVANHFSPFTLHSKTDLTLDDKIIEIPMDPELASDTSTYSLGKCRVISWM